MKAKKAPSEDAAIEIRTDFALDEASNGRSLLARVREEGLELLPDDFVKDRENGGNLTYPQPKARKDLSRALHKIQEVRHRALAPCADTAKTSLLVPGWSTLRDLIEFTEALLTAIESAFLTVSHDISSDARRPVLSLRKPLQAAEILQYNASSAPPSA